MLFDSHFHIIDSRFPLVANQGYLPEPFTVKDYLDTIQKLGLDCQGGAVVSGSFQAFDYTYLVDALKTLGPNYVGVVNLSVNAKDEEILRLNKAGVRAARFNLYRGGSESLDNLNNLASRIYDLAGWHIELYLDSKDLKELSPMLLSLPKVSIDHLGMSSAGFNELVALVEQGVHVKADGFMRVDFKVLPALKRLYKANPEALMFATDLPGTRASRVFSLDDLALIQDHFDAEERSNILFKNAHKFYQLIR